MRRISRRAASDRPPLGFRPAAETGYTCPLCGEDVVWWEEEYIRDEAGQICHAACVEEEMENGWGIT